MSFHKDAPLADIHVPYSFSYANQTAREAATGLLAEDVGKLALQEDNDTLWILTNNSPTTWKGVAGDIASLTHADLLSVRGDGDWHVKDDSQSIVLDKGPGVGIKVDLDTPSWGWRDLEGVELVDTVGGNAATLTSYRGQIREFSFGVGDIMDLKFHMPHDYLPGSDMFIHVHWSHNGTAISGNFEFDFHHIYAKGHDQAAFSADKNIAVVHNTVDIATTPQYQHMITEVPLSTPGGSATLLDTNQLEVDGLILVGFHVTAIPTITGGSLAPFVHRVDIHYQSTNIATLDKAPNFHTQPA